MILQWLWRTLHTQPYLYKLPAEILQEIAEILPPSSAASFALTSKYILCVVGRHYLQLEKTQRIEFLSTLQRDLRNWILCYYCEILHYLPPGRGLFFGVWSWARPRCAAQYLSTRVRCLNTPGLTFLDLQRTLNHYRYGLLQGLALRLMNTTRFKAYPRRLFSDEFKVIDDELFLKRDMVLGYRYNDSTTWNRAIRDIPRVCRHLLLDYQDSKPVEASNLTEESWLRCRVCGAEMRYEHKKLEDDQCEIRLTSWHAFGQCKSPFEEQWRRVCQIEEEPCEEPISPDQAVVQAMFEKASPAQRPPTWYYFLCSLLDVPGGGRYPTGYRFLLPYFDVGFEICS